VKKFLIFSTVMIFCVGAWGFVIPLFDRIPPINETTKTCLVTGASSGIGSEIAHEMVTRGWKVIGIARRADLLEKQKAQLGENFISYVCDVGNQEAVHKISEDIKAAGLKPTLFFLNAGTGELEEKWNISTAVHQRTFATNYFGALAWIEEWLPLVKRYGGGTFVATASIAALFATPGSAAYAASKAALVHSFQSLRLQYRNDNIGFSVVLPGPTDTEMLKGAGAKRLPFIHKPDDEARYIIGHVFAREKQIEPSWFYSVMMRVFRMLPDEVVMMCLKG